MQQKLTRNWPFFLLGLGATVAVTATFASLGYKPTLPSLSNTVPMMLPVRTPHVGGSGMEALRSLNDTFSQIAESVSGGVVQILPKASGSPERGMAANGSGSGFIYRSDGWIITNDHVVGDQSEVTVITHDGREYTGKVYTAKDNQIDLAVVKIEAKDLETLDLADMRTVRPGQFTMAVGSPFGLESSVTIGHVSALNRPGQVFDPRIGEFRGYAGMIQTDAAINPGNSGGPLLNIEGQVIGVNSTINTMTGSSAGIGFAIPATTVKIVADEMIATKKFDRGFLGIEFDRDLKPFEAKEMGISGGARVATVPEDGAAYKAGLRANDVILQIDNDKILSSNDLLLTMYRRSPGDKVTVKYLRGGKDNSVELTLTDMPQDLKERMQKPPAMQRRTPRDLDDLFPKWGEELRRNFEIDPSDSNQGMPEGRPKLGVIAEVIGDSQRRQFGLPQGTTGVVVTTVAEKSVAEKYGMEPGDVIISVQGAKVSSPTDLTEALSKIKWGQSVKIEFLRFVDGNKVKVSPTMPFEP